MVMVMVKMLPKMEGRKQRIGRVLMEGEELSVFATNPEASHVKMRGGEHAVGHSFVFSTTE